MPGAQVFAMWPLAFGGSIVSPDDRISGIIAEEKVGRL